MHMSFDVIIKLRNAFKIATRRNKQTMCPVLQDFIMTYVAATRLRKACFNNTLQSIVNVENLVIPSYERLKFRRQNEEEAEDPKCMIGTCGRPAVDAGTFNGKTYKLCSFHVEGYAGVQGWRFV